MISIFSTLPKPGKSSSIVGAFIEIIRSYSAFGTTRSASGKYTFSYSKCKQRTIIRSMTK